MYLGPSIEVPRPALPDEVWRDACLVAHDFVYILDRNGCYLDVNPRMCAAFRQSRDKLIGTRITLSLERDQLAVAERALQDILSNRRQVRSTRTYNIASAEPLYLETIETPLVRNGETWAIAGIARDITQEVLLEKKLWDTQDDRQAALDFTLRTSIGLVKGYIYTLGQTVLLSEEQRSRYVKIIEEEVDNLSRLIEDVLDMRRIESGAYELEGDVVDLQESVDATLSQFSDEAKRRNIEFVVTMPEKMDLLYLSRDGINRVIWNLVLNAIHHTMHSGTVKIEIEDFEDYIDMRFSDTSLGILEKDLPFVFEKFYQGRANTESSTQGPGYGLVVTRMLVTAMGGRIWATSKQSEGNVFHVMLPRRLTINIENQESEYSGMPAATPARDSSD